MKILASVLGGMVVGLIIGFTLGTSFTITRTPAPYVHVPGKTFTGLPQPR